MLLDREWMQCCWTESGCVAVGCITAHGGASSLKCATKGPMRLSFISMQPRDKYAFGRDREQHCDWKVASLQRATSRLKMRLVWSRQRKSFASIYDEGDQENCVPLGWANWIWQWKPVLVEMAGNNVSLWWRYPVCGGWWLWLWWLAIKAGPFRVFLFRQWRPDKIYKIV